ncbi:PQQ-binding-like beta-propeller repeat protein [Bordetella pseudohinzii]|uniref:Dehydrogenase n=1 Tax=Bordetella pseudohinzii TaxID=1331258 RepID=A0A0J6BW12_9BORD|nr:PQQ-binding-like beta-propeller repeat protein [Bordetella pseudohinzii]ANY14940.1 dehydrogenase [Bordetella pseudohinzii]KMM25969.1 dehydrogenase [Bordetella pseudohinzii]KXA78798.1 dehydrogenase [Bordetella pseudohinzii]KXA79265.1 dehydrogenase [Bordetella pseudohinzii]CUI95174.1 Quinate/shikimate dehydrogenase (quinone) [Bordetella pseudohinzii]
MTAVAGKSHVAAFGLAIVLAVSGVVLGIGGVKLALLGGSWYYVLTGLALVAAGVLLWHRNAWSAWLYAATLAGTLLWSLLQVGLDFWGLLARLAFPCLLGLGFWLPPVVRSLARGPRSNRAARFITAFFLLVFAILVMASVLRGDPASPPEILPAVLARVPTGQADGEWPGDPQGRRFSALTQVGPDNVAGLRVAWSYQGDDSDRARPFEIAPLKVGDSLYLCSSALVALDADTGRLRWRHRDEQRGATPSCRGLAYYRVPGMEEGALCAARLYATTADARLIAVDAKSGQPCRSFGGQGQIDLHPAAPMPGQEYMGSAPRVVRGKVVVAGWLRDQRSQAESAGALRAFDAETGQAAWSFSPATPDAQPALLGLSHAGAPLSVDETLGAIYLPTGNAMPDYYGRAVQGAAQRYSSAVVALDAQTGQERWVFQTTRHDVWGGDLAAQPTLLDLQYKGRKLPVLVQATRQGQLFLLDRRDGRPLRLDVALKPVAPADEESMWGVTPFDQLWCRVRLRAAGREADNPSFLRLPGPLAPSSWGGVAADPERGLLVINWAPGAAAPGQGLLVSPLGMSCNAPPHSYLTGVDLNDGHVLWNTRLAASYEAAWLFAPMPTPPPAGSLITGGGLVFIATGQEQSLRAVDLRSGDVLWKSRLPAGSQATPLSYQSASGRQFVLVATASRSRQGGAQGVRLTAYALPR